ncbi:von Willebrand factor A domain-containing protein 7 [Emydura macquarii macquarii]|uniref:von Willebrand factor A domain-containing protein 7 n=1 Tax=Emydura macquarii macquarii TaxID=1129001 RepID=UPI00352B97D5
MARWGPLWALPLLLLAPPGALGFFPNFWSRAMAAAWGSFTHQDLTEEALLAAALELLRGLPPPRGRERERGPAWEELEGRPLLADQLFAAYYGPGAPARRFRAALAEVTVANAALDFAAPARSDPQLHFDAERLRPAGNRLLSARRDLLQALGAEQYRPARRCLGQVLHSLQDFYSHSNWVELGHRHVHPDLLQPGRELGHTAGADVRTCSTCTGWTCEGNIPAAVGEQGLLTSGYFGTEPEKPPGKCSHGGPLDSSRLQEPQGGINKDSSSPIFSPHHYLHGPAAALAREASLVFLRELRRDLAHDKRFMRLLDLSAGAGLSIVLDTTGSMGEEISAARLQAREIVSRRLGGPEEPDCYLLVPFHDPGFGPAHKTSDADEFLKLLDSISPLAGGDEPEMCLSALQLALLHSPPMSEIFVFTDASAKDAHLRASVEALIQERRCKVTFLITEDPSRTRVRREVLAPDRFDLYVDLARVSGGQIIFTDNANIRQVAGVIGETTASTVTLFQYQKGGSVGPRGLARRGRLKRGAWETHRFWIDSQVDAAVVTVQGAVTAFRLRDPTGTSQTSDTPSGPLGMGQRLGSFHRIQLPAHPPVGRWTLEVQAPGNYSVHVRGNSSLDFFYYFAVPAEGPHPGLFKLESRPVRGLPMSLVLTVTGLTRPGGDSLRMEAVELADPVTGRRLGGELLLREGANGTGTYVADLPPTLPQGAFALILRGSDSQGRHLQRPAPQVSTAVGFLLQLSSSGPLYPGQMGTVAWRVWNPGAPQELGLAVSSDPGYPVSTSSPRLWLGRNQTATGVISLQVPDVASPASAVTVTLRADPLSPAGGANFAFLQLLVMPRPLTPTRTAPPCNVTWAAGTCGPAGSPCRERRWTAGLRIWDGAGIRSVLAGSVALPHRADGMAVAVTYSSDCCTREAELLVTNQLGEEFWCPVAAPPAGVAGGLAVAPCWWMAALAVPVAIYVPPGLGR